jgi:uncharacterized membrane protein (DUF2068 family)
VRRRDLGIELIALYKGAKALVELLLAAALFALAAHGGLGDLVRLAREIQAHLGSRWSHLAARAIASATSGRAVHLLELGLGLDGLLSALEGFSLWRGYRFGPWLVIAATSLPIPLEVGEIVRTHRPSRFLLLLLNGAVVIYLAVRLARRTRDKP